MKTIKRISLFLLCTVVIFASCKKKDTPEMLIANDWKLIDWTVSSEMQVPDSIKTKMLESARMLFMADKKFTFTGVNEKKTTGTYTLSEDGKILTLLMDDTKQYYIDTIKELTKTRMIIQDPMGNKLTVSRE